MTLGLQIFRHFLQLRQILLRNLRNLNGEALISPLEANHANQVFVNNYLCSILDNKLNN